MRNPNCPQTTTLEELIDQLEGDIKASTDGSVCISTQEAQTVVDALLWSLNQLSQRKKYSTRASTKNRILKELLEKRLAPDEKAELDRQIEAKTAERLAEGMED